jgi:hypothetical protein
MTTSPTKKPRRVRVQGAPRAVARWGRRGTRPVKAKPRAAEARRSRVAERREPAPGGVVAEGGDDPALSRPLRQVVEKLLFVHQSFADALLRLPRAEDYEPLVAPLQEFARIAPALVEALRGVVESTRALSAAVAVIEGASLRPGAALAAHREERGSPASASAVEPLASAANGLTRLDRALACVDTAHAAVASALAGLPGESDYRPVALQLRELATVSPSLMEWLSGVPKLTAPLRGSVQALRQAAADLRSAQDLLRDMAGQTGC